MDSLPTQVQIQVMRTVPIALPPWLPRFSQHVNLVTKICKPNQTMAGLLVIFSVSAVGNLLLIAAFYSPAKKAL